MKDKIIIEGGHKLFGEVRISGSKNATVALIPAVCLAGAPVTIYDAPNISDVDALMKLLEELNIQVKRSNEHIIIDPSTIKNVDLSSETVTKLRASYYFMGSLLGRFKYVKIKMPGGCYLGPRPIDLHLKGFEALGAKVEYHDGFYEISAKELVGDEIYLDVPSVGATINIMMAAVFAKGRTKIENVAKEPEIIDVATMLNKMGANIRGAGTDEITIDGVEKLGGCYHEIIPDRIEASTYIIMGAACAKRMKITNIIPQHLEALISKLEEAGVPIEVDGDSVTVEASDDIKPIEIKTLPYPGFATDMQSMLGALLTKAKGMSQIKETIYPERFKYCQELNKMGANIMVNSPSCLIMGPTKLQGVEVQATDLRCGAALVIAALMAEGTTTITDAYHIYRGYENLFEKLHGLNAVIGEC
ncbi:MAG: UDP-N-acetylglucosamine 1-carboxyvinyltransferase [Erysipelotrichaceae bacterium]|nr:UDP-N-acetylglucosamine 1-carboxyvinyltransferase [Erysipelotrichaceae bacterium]